MSYKKYILKKLIPLQLGVFTIFTIMIAFVEFNYIDKSLESKKYLLKEKNVEIIFAGDSRAQRQLNPIVAKNYLKTKNYIINIAVDSGDVVMLEYLIKEYPGYFKDKNVFLSISPNQLNDGADDLGYFSNAMISKLSLHEKIKRFYPLKKELLVNYYKDGIKNIVKVKKKKFENTYGFYPTKGSFKINEEFNPYTHPWYKAKNFQGIKFKIVQESLQFIKQNVKSLFLYTTSFAPTYYLNNKDKIDPVESDFINTFSGISIRLGIPFKYYNFFNLDFKDDYFSDSAHLNTKGATIFTKIILDDFYGKSKR